MCIYIWIYNIYYICEYIIISMWMCIDRYITTEYSSSCTNYRIVKEDIQHIGISGFILENVSLQNTGWKRMDPNLQKPINTTEM